MASSSISGRLRVRLIASGAMGAATLLLFIVLDLDSFFDKRYRQFGLTGLAYEIGDHVVVPLVALLLPMTLMASWVIRQALVPLGTAADRINAASGMDRGFRVALKGIPVEASPFVIAVNDLLRRLDDAAERHEAFAADVAHELKTPLTILALELDGLDGPLAKRLKADVLAMNRLIEQMLVIAQLDAATASRTAYDRFALGDLAAEVVGRLAPLAVNVGRTLALDVQQSVVIAGRAEAVAATLRNLIENSLRATPAGTVVTVIVGPGAQVRVRDQGPGVTVRQLELMQRRLFRADHASAPGNGLGLAIVSKIMTSHSGWLETDPEARELKLIFNQAPGFADQLLADRARAANHELGQA